MLNKKMLLTTIDERVAKNGKPFVSLTFVDSDKKSISSKLWDTKKDSLSYKTGIVYEVTGQESDYMGTKQIDSPTLIETNDSPYDYMKTSKVPVYEIKEYIFTMYEEINNPLFKQLIVKMFKIDVDGNSFWNQPAASGIHEAYPVGLAYHTYNLLKISKGFMDSGLYEEANKDILYTAIMIHDVGKIYEISDPINREYTLVGQLLGHISILDGIIAQFMFENNIAMDDSYFLNLRHCLLAHHGKLEFGSPVVPKTLEAAILHQIDMAHSQIAQYEEKLEETEDEDFSEYSKYLQASVYKHGLK